MEKITMENIILDIKGNINKAKVQPHRHSECDGAGPEFTDTALGPNLGKFSVDSPAEML